MGNSHNAPAAPTAAACGETPYRPAAPVATSRHPLPAPGQPDPPENVGHQIVAFVAGDDPGVTSILAFIRTHLAMDLAYVGEFVDGRQIYRALEGDALSFGIKLDDGPALASTYSKLMVDGEVPGVVGDTAADGRLRELPATTERRIGSYIGVPLRRGDGSLLGALCCVSHEPNDTLDERDRQLMTMFAVILAERLEISTAAHNLHARVERALCGDAITVAMQPVISLMDGTCIGVEALARFPDAGLAPNVMFQHAYNVGLGEQLELVALRAALRHRHSLPAGLHLSVNVSPQAILAPGFDAAIRSTGPLSGLTLEVTEHVVIAEYEALSAVLTPLRAEGLQLAVDDVGAGYASLRHVLRMRPDIIKVDRSLVDGITRDAAQRSILTSIMLLSLDLGADVVAEGVENTSDAATLADLGVDMVQGYLFARPTTDTSEWPTWARAWAVPAHDRRPRLVASDLRLAEVAPTGGGSGPTKGHNGSSGPRSQRPVKATTFESPLS